RIAQPQPELVYDPALPHHELRRSHQRIDLALVDALKAGAIQPGDRRIQLHALAADQEHGVAGFQAELFGQRLADDNAVRRPREVVELALAHLRGEFRDVNLAAGVDTGQGDADTRAAVIDDRGG